MGRIPSSQEALKADSPSRLMVLLLLQLACLVALALVSNIAVSSRVVGVHPALVVPAKLRTALQAHGAQLPLKHVAPSAQLGAHKVDQPAEQVMQSQEGSPAAHPDLDVISAPSGQKLAPVQPDSVSSVNREEESSEDGSDVMAKIKRMMGKMEKKRNGTFTEDDLEEEERKALEERRFQEKVWPYEPAPDPDGWVSGALRTLNITYEGGADDAFKFKVRSELAREEIRKLTGSELPATYGEISPRTVASMLHVVGAKHGWRYYDFGSGTGKTPALAWLLGLDATGIELSSERWGVSCKAIERLKSHQLDRTRTGPRLRAVKASFLDVDFSDADIIFANSVMFTPAMTRDLIKAMQRLRPGAIVVTAHGHSIPQGAGFRLVKNFAGPASWSNGTSWTFQVREETSSGVTAGDNPKVKQSMINPETCEI